MGFTDTRGSNSPRGMMLLRPEVRSFFQSYRITQIGCQVRLYPELDANGNAMPIRAGRELRDVGDWANSDHFGISYLGGGDPSKEKVTMLLSIKGDDKLIDPSQRRGLRVWDQLRNTLYWRLNDGTAPSHWSRWAASSMDAVLGTPQHSKAKPLAFVRGMLTWYNTSKGPMRTVSHNNPQTRCVFYLPPAAQNALIELAMAQLDGAQNYHGDDWDKVFRFNNKIVDPQTGCLINFGRPGQVDPAAAQQQQAPASVSFGSAGVGQRGMDMDQFRVEAHVLENQPVPLPMEIIRDCASRPWDQVLYVHEDEASLIRALEVGFPDDLIIAAFGDQPELLSERLRSRMTQMAGLGQPQQYQQRSQTGAMQFPPSSGGMAPTPGGMAPAPGGMAPATGNMYPPPGGMAPAPGGMAPAPGGMAPAPGGATPPSGNTAPLIPPSYAPPLGYQQAVSSDNSVSPALNTSAPAPGDDDIPFDATPPNLQSDPVVNTPPASIPVSGAQGTQAQGMDAMYASLQQARDQAAAQTASQSPSGN